MSKNVIVMPMVIPKDKGLHKFGGWKWMEISHKAWKFWCDKNNCELVVYDTPSIEDLGKYRITVQRWFDLFEFVDNKGIEYDKIAMIDASSIPRWDCPNFFDLTDGKFTAGIENDNLRWVYESIIGYKKLFNDYELDITKYFNTSFIILEKQFRYVLDEFKNTYMNKDYAIRKVQSEVKRGTCQTPLNYVVQKLGIDINFLPVEYRMSHLPRKDLLNYNWQLDEDKTPFFIKYGKVWFFSGFDKTTRNDLMTQTWETVKGNYK